MKDKRALRKIAAALEINSRDTIVEVGPGHGELTRVIVDKFISLKVDKFRIIAIEKDPKLVSKLISLEIGKFIEVVEGDALKELESITYKLTAKRNLRTYKLCGNIPYYLTGHLLRKISELDKKPELIVFTVQKEVAERVCANPPRMNLLAASVQFWGDPKVVGYISKKSFRPQPKVDSAIIKITPSSQPRYSGVERMGTRGAMGAEEYYKFIRILFKQPRKTVLNNLRAGTKLSQKEVEKRLQKLNISPSLRPANLSMSDINKLAIIFSNKRV